VPCQQMHAAQCCTWGRRHGWRMVHGRSLFCHGRRAPGWMCSSLLHTARRCGTRQMHTAQHNFVPDRCRRTLHWISTEFYERLMCRYGPLPVASDAEGFGPIATFARYAHASGLLGSLR
jgi:hypothetical protein